MFCPFFFIIKFIQINRNVWAGRQGGGKVEVMENFNNATHGRQELRESFSVGGEHLSANHS